VINELLMDEKLLGHLPVEVQEQEQDILARILRLAGYQSNSNTDSNSVGGTNLLPTLKSQSDT
jgi:hypothetical protein